MPKRTELPEALVEAITAKLTKATVRLSEMPEDGEGPFGPRLAEDVTRAVLALALDTNHLLLVPEDEVGVSLTREEATALRKACKWHRADDPLVNAYVKLSTALQDNE